MDDAFDQILVEWLNSLTRDAADLVRTVRDRCQQEQAERDSEHLDDVMREMGAKEEAQNQLASVLQAQADLKAEIARLTEERKFVMQSWAHEVQEAEASNATLRSTVGALIEKLNLVREACAAPPETPMEPPL